MGLDLFCNLKRGALFKFYGRSGTLVKNDETHYISPTGIKKIHPHVAVWHEPEKEIKIRSIYDRTERGDAD